MLEKHDAQEYALILEYSLMSHFHDLKFLVTYLNIELFSVNVMVNYLKHDKIQQIIMVDLPPKNKRLRYDKR